MSEYKEQTFPKSSIATIDGAPMARFISELSRNLETGIGLWLMSK